MLTNDIFQRAEDQLLDVPTRFSAALEKAGIRYRVVGGLAWFLHVDAVDPIAARLTPDVDVAVYRQDLDAILAAAEAHGFR